MGARMGVRWGRPVGIQIARECDCHHATLVCAEAIQISQKGRGLLGTHGLILRRDPRLQVRRGEHERRRRRALSRRTLSRRALARREFAISDAISPLREPLGEEHLPPRWRHDSKDVTEVAEVAKVTVVAVVAVVL